MPVLLVLACSLLPATPSTEPVPSPSVLPVPAVAPASTVASWIPPRAASWTEQDRVEHDLDADGHTDVAVVLTAPSSARGESDRLLVVARWTPEGYTRVLETPCIALCQGCGGAFGDPYDGLEVVGERSLKVSNYGGSSWRWSSSYTLAWRDGAMAVVGYDSTSFHASEPEKADITSINLLNGRATQNGVVRRHSSTRIPAHACDRIEVLGSASLDGSE